MRPCILFFVIAFAVRVPAVNAETVPSFVAGFERFGRHGDRSAGDAGALLVSELSCTACHADNRKQLAPKTGPNLSGVGLRLNEAWLRKYLDSPSQMKPGTTMPDVLASLSDADKAESIDALLAFLSTQRRPFAEPKAGGANPLLHQFWLRGDVHRGQELYHSVGCVACHEPDAKFETSEAPPSAIDKLIDQLDPEELADMGLAAEARRVNSVPHGDLVAKYSRRSLTMMLLDPAKDRPSSRMPSLRLTPDEATDIATFLLKDKADQGIHFETNGNRNLIEKGKRLFVQLRCANCHITSGKVDKSIASRSFAELRFDADSSCVAAPSEKMPRYSLDGQQADSIKKRFSGDELEQSSASIVSQNMLQKNCYACHRRDEIGGVGRYRKAYFETHGQVDMGDEGRLPPPLTGVGNKLTARALKSVFNIKGEQLRPHMTIRMPTYHDDAIATVLENLPKADKVDASTPKEIAGGNAKELAKIGHALVDTGCAGCHTFGGESLPGVVGVDLDSATNRLRPSWFQQFLRNPVELKKRSRMPTFFPDGKSNRPDLVDGDVDKQIAAIWFYLKDRKQQPLPKSIADVRAKDFELQPKSKPVILRTFMKDVGTHAIAVGFPEGKNYAFDAERSRFVLGWNGRFLDARGTWFERFTPPADPLADVVKRFPAGDSFFIRTPDFPKPLQATFGGYTVDARGVPSMTYQLGDRKVTDTLRPSRKGLERTIVIQNSQHRGDELLWLAHAGSRLTRVGPMSFKADNELTVTVEEGIGHAGELQRIEQKTQWLIPLGTQRDNEHTQIKAVYEW